MARRLNDVNVVEKLLNIEEDTHVLKEMCHVCCVPLMMCCDKDGSVIKRGCGHRTCKNMMQGWIAAQVEALCGVEEIKSSCCSVLLTPCEVNQYATPLVAQRAERHTLEKALVKMDDWIWCPSCSSGGFTTTVTGGACDESDNGKCRSVICAECNFEFCGECGVSESLHTRIISSPYATQCADAERHIEVKENDVTSDGKVWLKCSDAAQSYQNQQWLDNNSKKCPKEYGGCGVITQRDGGCSHMRCHLCQFQWCWICGGKYTGKYTMTGTKCPC